MVAFTFFAFGQPTIGQPFGSPWTSQYGLPASMSCLGGDVVLRQFHAPRVGEVPHRQVEFQSGGFDPGAVGVDLVQRVVPFEVGFQHRTDISDELENDDFIENRGPLPCCAGNSRTPSCAAGTSSA